MKHKIYLNELEMDCPMDTLNTMDIYFKATPLKPTAKDGLKVMCGFKFSPKIQLTKESKQAVEDMIKAGEHLKNYTDFVSGKFASRYTATKFVEMAGYVVGLFEGYSGTPKEKGFKEICEILFKGYEKGVDDGSKIEKPKEETQ